MDLAGGIEEYLLTLRVERGLATNTLAAYRRDLAQYRAFLDQAPPSVAEVERFFDVLAGAGLQASTLARKLAAVRGLHRFMAAEGLADTDPTASLEGPRRPDPIPKALGVDEAIRLVEAPDTTSRRGRRDAALLELLYGTGARVSEAVNMDLGDLDLDDAQARLIGKGDRQRLVPLGSAAIASIRRWLPDRLALYRPATPGDPVFLNLRGGRLTRQGAYEVVKRAARSVGIAPARVSPHVLRHSAATHMVEGGADLRTVQELLGHATLTTTQVYTRVSPQHLLEIFVQAHPRSR